MNLGAAGQAFAVDEMVKERGTAPSKPQLVEILRDKRMKLLSELRDIEQALEALEHTPDFEPTFQRVLKILQRSY